MLATECRSFASVPNLAGERLWASKCPFWFCFPRQPGSGSNHIQMPPAQAVPGTRARSDSIYGLVEDGTSTSLQIAASGSCGALQLQTDSSPDYGALRVHRASFVPQSEDRSARSSHAPFKSSDGSSMSTTNQCMQLCDRLQARLRAEDIFLAPNAQGSSSCFRTKSTVGMMLNGCVVDSLVVGGPGYNSGQLDRGDVVIKVDQTVVDKDTILAALVGDDAPGSEVSLTIQKGGRTGNVRVISLQRMATERIADRRRIFELFTLIKDRATQLDDDKIPLTVDKCISLWTNMLVSDAYYQEKAVKRFKALQDQAIAWIDELRSELVHCKSACVPTGTQAKQMPREGCELRRMPQDKDDQNRHFAEPPLSPPAVGVASVSGATVIHGHRGCMSNDEVCSQLGQMQIELQAAIATIHNLIDGQPSELKFVIPVSAQTGAVSTHRSTESKATAKLEYELGECRREAQRWQAEAEKAREEANRARLDAQERLITESLWRKKAEDCYREKSVMEEQWRREREQEKIAISDIDASLRDDNERNRELVVQLEASICQLEQKAQIEGRAKKELEEACVSLESKLQNKVQAMEESMMKMDEKHDALMSAQRSQHSSDIQLLKEELRQTIHWYTSRIDMLEQEIQGLQTESREMIDQSPIKNAKNMMDTIRNESLELHHAVTDMLNHVHSYLAGTDPEKQAIINKGHMSSFCTDNAFNDAPGFVHPPEISLAPPALSPEQKNGPDCSRPQHLQRPFNAIPNCQVLKEVAQVLSQAQDSFVALIALHAASTTQAASEADKARAKEAHWQQDIARLEERVARFQKDSEHLDILIPASRKLEEQLAQQIQANAQLQNNLTQLEDARHDLQTSREHSEHLQRQCELTQHEMQQLKSVNRVLLTDISALEKDLAHVKYDSRTRSSIAQDPKPDAQELRDVKLRREFWTKENMAKGTAGSRTDNELTAGKLEAALARIRQQDEEIKELKGYCKALHADLEGQASALGVA